MKKKLFGMLCVLLFAIMTLLLLISCDNREAVNVDSDIPNENYSNQDAGGTSDVDNTDNGKGTSNETHVHTFSMWNITTAPTCTVQGIQTRSCETCGFKEQSSMAPTGHVKVIDEEIPATCTLDGKTEGSHCSACQEVLKAQVSIQAKGHKYNDGVIETEATCISEGTKKFTCTAEGCNHTYNEQYSLPTYTATELFNQSVKYVGEIVTYDKSGDEYALGTGFVCSEDGRIITNYHVIDGAYSAKITIDGKTYNIASVLAYDADIDLAVLKIKASGLSYATICKKAISVGATVYAIGSSRGMTNTYSQGIVTYADRMLDGISYVQHDASITHGNSGGPLINIYGEVVGINTWGVDDSQNLNFAVFAKELDNLTFGTPLTMAEFYEKECNVFIKIKNYIIKNGTYSAEYGWYCVTLGTTYSSDYSSKYTRRSYYFIDEDIISFDLLIDDDYGECWAYFEIDENVDGSYYWSYFDENDYEMSGTLYSSTYSSNSLLGYSYNNIYDSSLRNSVRELASTMISVLCSWIDTDLEDIGVTAEDIGFYNY